MRRSGVVVAAMVAAGVLSASGPVPVAARASCTQESVRNLVASFVDAYNRGDVDLLDRIFVRGDRFQEYRVLPIERGWPESANRGSLLTYFKQRHQQGDRFILKGLHVGRARAGGFHFQAQLERRSKDIRPWGSGDFVPQKSGVTPDCKIKLFRIQWNGP